MFIYYYGFRHILNNKRFFLHHRFEKSSPKPDEWGRQHFRGSSKCFIYSNSDGWYSNPILNFSVRFTKKIMSIIILLPLILKRMVVKICQCPITKARSCLTDREKRCCCAAQRHTWSRAEHRSISMAAFFDSSRSSVTVEVGEYQDFAKHQAEDAPVEAAHKQSR